MYNYRLSARNIKLEKLIHLFRIIIKRKKKLDKHSKKDIGDEKV